MGRIKYSSSRWSFRLDHRCAPDRNGIASPSPDLVLLECYWTGSLGHLNNWASSTPATTSYIDNGGTATIGNGDNVTDMTGGYGDFYIGGGGGGNYPGDTGGNGYVIMTGGTLTASTGAGNLMSQKLGSGSLPSGISSSGVFTQSGGVNCPYQNPEHGCRVQ